MSTNVQSNDILAARVWTTFGNQAAVNTYNYKAFSVVGGGINDDDFSAAFDVLVSTTYKGIMTTDCTYNGIQTYYKFRVSGDLPAPVKYVVTAGPALQTPPTLPGQAAAVFSYSSLIRGPGGRGRVYLPFIGTGLLASNGLQDASLISAINAMASLLLTPITIVSGGNSASFVWSLLKRLPGPTLLYRTSQIVTAESSRKFGQIHKRGAYGRVNTSPI